MSFVEMGPRVLDARPDRVDYRDRPYTPPLRSLPDEYPSPDFIATHLREYTARGLVLKQRAGECTGYGLAAVINYLLWRRSDGAEDTPRVSPDMLYRMARLYDEWDGEAYEGSSCRGAMKGWHHHGVCTEEHWSRRCEDGASPWTLDAARRPLGAYYRIERDSIADLQAAVHEVGAVYASANIHPGWEVGTSKTLPQIAPEPGTGGHAFAIVGYDRDGLIVQNSWGSEWGAGGFAILLYEDWVQNGLDVWVASMGAPMRIDADSRFRTRTELSLEDQAARRSRRLVSGDPSTTRSRAPTRGLPPLDEGAARELTIVTGNNGQPINRFVDLDTPEEAVREVGFRLPRAHFETRPPTLAIYAHGGLNSEADSIRRIRVLAPYFLANDVYPLFVSWRTGVLESLGGHITDAVAGLFDGGPRARGLLSDLRDALAEARDRTIEVAAHRFLVRAIWAEMKQNAEAARLRGGALALLKDCLASLREETPELRIHLIGHSAGSLVLGHLLRLLTRTDVKVTSVSLYAPACTAEFTLRYYAHAARKGVFDLGRLHIDALSDERERADHVSGYGKSLLYLVSRALEDRHKTPLLGMHALLRPESMRDRHGAQVGQERLWHDEELATVRRFESFRRTLDDDRLRLHDSDREYVSNGVNRIRLAHGSFDNDVDVIEATLRRIRGDDLLAPVTNLLGY